MAEMNSVWKFQSLTSMKADVDEHWQFHQEELSAFHLTDLLVVGLNQIFEL